MLLRCIILATTLPFIAGFCEGMTTDPREGGYFGGKCGLMTGAYERRVRILETERDNLDLQNDQLKHHLRSDEFVTGALAKALSGSRRRLSRVQGELKDLTTELENRRAKSNANQVEVNQLNTEKAAMEAEIRRLYNQAAATEIAARNLKAGLLDAGAKKELEQRLQSENDEADAFSARARRDREQLLQ